MEAQGGITCAGVSSLTSSVRPSGNKIRKDPFYIANNDCYCDPDKSQRGNCFAGKTQNPWTDNTFGPTAGLPNTPAHYAAVEMQLKKDGYTAQDLGCKVLPDVDFGKYVPSDGSPCGSLVDNQGFYDTGSLPKESTWKEPWSCVFDRDPVSNQIYKVKWDPSVVSGQDREACCLGTAGTNNLKCEPDLCFRDPAGKCSQYVVPNCLTKDEALNKASMLTPGDRCNDWYQVQQATGNADGLDLAIKQYCAKFPAQGECSCYNFAVNQSGQRSVIIGDGAVAPGGQALVRHDSYCIPAPSGAKAPVATSKNDGSASCAVYCAQNVNGEAGSANPDCKAAKVNSSGSFVGCNKVVGEAVTCFCGNADTDPTAILAAASPESHDKFCKSAGQNPISGTQVDTVPGSPPKCWLADCQASVDTKILKSPTQFAEPCPATCFSVASGQKIGVQETTNDVPSFQVAGLIATCNFGPDQKQPLGTAFGIEGGGRVQYEEFLQPGSKVQRCLNVVNLANDTHWPKYGQISWSAYSTVPSLVSLGKSTGQLLNNGKISIPVTIDASAQAEDAAFYAEIVLLDANGLNEPLRVPISVFVTSAGGNPNPLPSSCSVPSRMSLLGASVGGKAGKAGLALAGVGLVGLGLLLMRKR